MKSSAKVDISCQKTIKKMNEKKKVKENPAFQIDLPNKSVSSKSLKRNQVSGWWGELSSLCKGDFAYRPNKDPKIPQCSLFPSFH